MLKFRLFTGVEMILPERINYIDFNRCAVNYCDEYDGNKLIIFDQKCDVLMEFTGLIDMNDTEIYSDDVVEAYCCSKKLGVGRIMFKNSQWQIEWHGDETLGLRNDLQFFADKGTVKVVGNIHTTEEYNWMQKDGVI